MRRRMLASVGKALPYDAEVEYLESSHSVGQFIDTGFKPNGLTTFEIDFKLTSVTTDYPMSIFGCTGVSNTDNGLALSKNTTSTEHILYYGSYGGSGTFHTNEVNLNRKVLMSSFDLGIYKFGVSVKPILKFQSDRSAYLFARNAGFSSSLDGSADVRVFGFKLFDDGVLKVDLHPVLVGNEGAMYDRVSGQLFRNAGTGAFIIGPDKVSQLGGV